MTRSIGNNWLLTIAIDKYQDENIPNLFNPVQDAQQLEQVLKEQYGFAEKRINRCFDKEATRRGILSSFRRIRNKIEENDSLIIYHAGHGILNETKTRGYWISYDAEQGEIDTCVSCRNIIDKIEDFTKCRHVILISDSCYAGSMIPTRDFVFESDQDLGELFRTPSRWIITSGRNKPVVDGMPGEGSPFALSLIDQLEKNTDTLRVSTLADKVLELTENKTNKKQTPNFAQLVIPGNEGGQFIFKKRKEKTPSKKSLDPLMQDLFSWEKAERTNTVEAYQDYLTNYPSGDFIEQAKSHIAKFEDVAAWATARREDSLSSYETYLSIFPEGRYKIPAKAAQDRIKNAISRQRAAEQKQHKFKKLMDQALSLFQSKDYSAAIELWKEAYELADSGKKKFIDQQLSQAKKKLEETETHPYLQELGIEMITIEGGSFMMGSKDGNDDEKPVHEVSLSSFQLAKTPITQQQWEQVMGKNPSSFKGCPDCPVETVSWNDTQEFLKTLSQQTGQSFDLPTEAQWEFAARGGNLSKGFTYAGGNTPDEVGWYWKNSGDKPLGVNWLGQGYEWEFKKIERNNCRTQPVGQKKPNELGLYDMSGNVWEWCQDWYGSYPSGSQTDPTGPISGTYRVYRGGSWNDVASYLRVAYRNGWFPSFRHDYRGFRPARTP